MVHTERQQLRETPKRLIGDYFERLIGGAISDYRKSADGYKKDPGKTRDLKVVRAGDCYKDTPGENRTHD